MRKPTPSNNFHRPWRLVALFLVNAIILQATIVAGDPAGVWEGPYNTTLIAVAAANLPDGRIVYWSAYDRFWYLGTTGETYTGIFDPNTGAVVETLVQHTEHDMFCPGTAMLEDGRVMITGGSSSKKVTFYDSTSDTWSVGPEMLIRRGYHSMTVLDDGRVFTVGGSFSGARGRKDGEIFDPASNTWTKLSGIQAETISTNDSGGIYRADNHMWLFQSPDGRIFHAGPSRQMHWIDVSGQGAIKKSVTRGSDVDAMNGNAVMYDVGKLLTVGGAENYDEGDATATTHIIDINGNEASVERVGDMNFKRVLSNSVVLPSGEVLVVGGQYQVKLFSDLYAQTTPEIWSPITHEWRPLAQHVIARNYHSVAILLKDGRVFAGGGGLCNKCKANHADAEILTPPYLLNSDGSMANRPVISKAPARVNLGTQILVDMDTDGDHTFALVRLSAVTHSINNDNRRVPLEVVRRSLREFHLHIPANGAVVPPGSYYLFAMNSLGVPSIAETIRVTFDPVNEVFHGRCAALDTDKVYHIIGRSSAKALTVDEASLQDGADVVQYQSSKYDHDNWVLESASDGYYRLIAEHSKFGLTVEAAGIKKGDSLVQREVTYSEEFDWCFLDVGSGYFQIENRKSGLVVDVAKFSKNDGAKIHQWAYLGNPNQEWKLLEIAAKNEQKSPTQFPTASPTNRPTKAPTPDPVSDHSSCESLSTTETFYISNRLSGLSLFGEPLQDGDQIIQSSEKMAWKLEHTTGQYYKITTTDDEMALSIQFGSLKAGSNLIQLAMEKNGGARSHWCFRRTGNSNSYVIENRRSGLILDIQGPSKLQEGSEVYQWENEAELHQQWEVKMSSQEEGTQIVTESPTDAPVLKTSGCHVPPSDTSFMIVSRRSGMGLLVNGEQTVKGASIVQSKHPNLWHFEEFANGYVHIVSNDSNHMGIAVAEGSTEKGADVVQWQIAGNEQNPAMIWCLLQNPEDYFEVKNLKSGNVLDVQNFSRDEDGNIHQWKPKGSKNQQWQLVLASNARASASLSSPISSSVGQPQPTTAGCSILPEGTYFQISSQPNDHLGLAASEQLVGTTTQRQIVQSYRSDLWSLSHSSDGYYHIFSQTGGAIGVHETPSSRGASIVLRQMDHSDSSLEWCWVEVDSGLYRVENRASKLVLDVEQFSASEGGRIQQWQYAGNQNQKWQLSAA